MNKLKKLKLKYFIGGIFILITQVALSCPVCDREKANQVTLGLSHGAGPDHNWEWLVVAGMAGITLFALFLAIKYFIKPDNAKTNEFKKSIFSENELM